jgi:phosphatidylglycerophosphatase A
MKSLGMGITAAVFLLGLAGFVLFRASRVEVQRPWPLQQGEEEKLSV